MDGQFRKIITDLETVRRFDFPTSSKAIEFGEVVDGDHTRLALQVEGIQGPVVLEEHGQEQLARRWDIPPEHLARLPRRLQVAELEHFTRREPKNLTLRTIETVGGGHTLRAAMSGRYVPFDSAEVLAVAEPILEGWDISRPDVERDSMALTVTRPNLLPVRSRTKGDIVKIGLAIRNNEVGEGSVAVDFFAERLVCTNGLVRSQSEVSIHQRHIGIGRTAFAAMLRAALSSCLEVGRALVGQMEKASALRLTNLDPDNGDLQRAAVKILRAGGMWGRENQDTINQRLGVVEEASLYGLVQILTDRIAKGAKTSDERIRRETVAGQILALAN